MLTSIFLAVLFISVLITIHEFGHLIVAKLAKIPVEVFSVGFGPAIIRRKIGETEYRLSAVPLGGYIKMVGEEERAAGPAPAGVPTAIGFNDKPLGVKAAVIAAGPVSNLVLGFLFLLTMYLGFGVKYFAPVLDPQPGSPAAAAGLETADLVLFAAGETIPDFDAFEKAVERNAGQAIPLVVRRGAEHLELVYPIPADTWFSVAALSPVVGDVRSGSPAARLGLKPGDTIVALAGEPIENWQQFTAIARRSAGRTIGIAWRRNGRIREDSIAPVAEADPATGEKVGKLGVWVESPRRYIEPLIPPVVGQVRRGGPAHRVGLRPGDAIISVAGTGVRTWDEFTRAVNTRGGEKLEITWRRSGRLFTDSLVPALEADQLSGQRVGEIGVWSSLPRKYLSLPSAAWQALTRTGYVVVQTFVIIYNVVTRKLPGRAIGGPIMVAKIAYEGASWGPEYFIALWALLSINLFVVNMLPIPVMDGGRILLFGIEGIRRRKLTERELAWAANIGWVLIGALIVFTLFNDLTRLIRK